MTLVGTELRSVNPARNDNLSNNMALPAAPSALTLSFGGVDFRLTPDLSTEGGGDPLMSLTHGANSVLLNLSSFTGSLCVTLSHKLPTTEQIPCVSTTATVEEEDPPSPQRTNQTGQVATPSPAGNSTLAAPFTKGQLQLPFAKSNEKATTKKAKQKEKETKSTTSKRTLQQDTSMPTVTPSKKKTRQQKELENIDQEPSSTPTLGQTSQSTATQSIEASTGEETMDVDKSVVGVESTSFENNEIDDEEDDKSMALSAASEKENSSWIETTSMEITESPTVEKIVSDEKHLSISASPSKSAYHPIPRWGQTMTMIDHSRIIVYGGQADDTENDETKTMSDLHVYDASNRSWSKPVNCEGVPRQWHSATFLPERQLLISFGGESVSPKTGKISTTDQVMVLDTEIMLWYPPSVSGQVPSGRSGHTASLLPNTNELVVFGGVKGSKWLNSAAVLDTIRWKWTSPKILGNPPRPRSYHSATPIGSGSGPNSSNRLVIFGGNDDGTSFNTVHVLDAKNGSKWSWFHPEMTGPSPAPRTGHIGILLDDNKTILIYGGWDPNADEGDDEEHMFDDCWLLDTELWMWTEGPKPKYIGSAAPNAGTARVGHSAVLAPGENGAQVLIFGGRTPNEGFAADFQSLSVEQKVVGLGR